MGHSKIVEEDIQPKVLIYEAPGDSEESAWKLLLGSETEAEMNDDVADTRSRGRIAGRLVFI